jgi:hypothetical protein
MLRSPAYRIVPITAAAQWIPSTIHRGALELVSLPLRAEQNGQLTATNDEDLP